jgi:hypothetical protein
VSTPLHDVVPDRSLRVGAGAGTSAGALSGTAADRVTELRERMNGMQRDRWEPQGRPVAGALSGLLPHGVLRSGVVYTVDNSTSLVMAALGSATAEGAWAAVVGLPDFGVEAAADFGIDLARLVLVPAPGEHWLAVTAALVDVLPLVVVQPQRTVGAAEMARLSARLRQSGCTLVVAGAWAQSEAALCVTGTGWEGVGAGHGYLTGRTLGVTVAERNGPRREELIHLPDPAGTGPAGTDPVGTGPAGTGPALPAGSGAARPRGAGVRPGARPHAVAG